MNGKNIVSRDFFYATSVLVGTIVGVGVFGLPYVASQAGFIVGLFFLLVFGGGIMLIHLLYGEVTLRTEESHRLVGFAKLYLGDGAKRLAACSNILGFYGALLAYMIVAGSFLKILVGSFLPFSQDHLAIFFYIFGSAFILFHIRFVARVEFYMSIFLIGAVLTLFLRSIPHIDFGNFVSVSRDVRSLFLPYGVVLFSLAGAAAIPEMKDMLKGENARFIKRAIFIGTCIPIILYILFMYSIVGVEGTNTHPEAIPGLARMMGNWVVVMGALFGVFAVFTSFLVIGLNLKEIFWYDYHIPPLLAWVLVVVVPLVLYLGGLKEFIKTIGLVGGIMGGIDGVLIILIALAAKKKGTREPEYEIQLPRFLPLFLMSAFVLGILLEVFYFFIR